MTVTKTQAKELAIAYCAYHFAVEEGNGLGIRVWGQRLLEMQEITEIEMNDPVSINNLIKLHYDESKYKVGSLVKCIDAEGMADLTLNKTYEVLGVNNSSNSIKVKDDVEDTIWYSMPRFIPVPPVFKEKDLDIKEETKYTFGDIELEYD